MNQWKMRWLTVLLGAFATCAFAASAAQPAMPASGFGQDQAGWDVPPPNFTQTQANGFRDGIVAGQDDIAHRLQPNATGRPEYRNPPQMPFLQRVMYRDGFQKGYQRVMDRFYNAPPPPPQPVYVAPPPPAPAPGRGDLMSFRHRGFQEGMDGALKDLENHRNVDPNNRDEFRHPSVPFGMQEPYRDGFRHGYDSAMRAMTGYPDEWRRGPESEVRTRGYHDGAIGAIRDWENNRRPEPNNRDEFRRPNAPPQMQDAYRDAFRRGYSRISQEMNGYFGGR